MAPDQHEKCKTFLKEFLACAGEGCNQLVVNCDLEDKVRGFGEKDSIDKYMPLNTCLKCLEI